MFNITKLEIETTVKLRLQTTHRVAGYTGISDDKRVCPVKYGYILVYTGISCDSTFSAAFCSQSIRMPIGFERIQNIVHGR
jgi:hypothetical protein